MNAKKDSKNNKFPEIYGIDLNEENFSKVNNLDYSIYNKYLQYAKNR